MSIYNLDALFTYDFPTSSLNYIRNYNFNTSTVSDLPLTIANLGTEIPITVDITTTQPWVRIIDAVTGANLTYPIGNVVLQPTSSKLLKVSIDLPPNIESITETTVKPNILLNARSGSFAIVQPENSGEQQVRGGIVLSAKELTLFPNQTIQVEFTVYNEDGTPDTTLTKNDITLTPSNFAAVPFISTGLVASYSPITIQGQFEGTTTIRIAVKEYEETINVTVVAANRDADRNNDDTGNGDNDTDRSSPPPVNRNQSSDDSTPSSDTF